MIKESDYVAHLGNSEDFLNKFEHLISSKTNLVAISDGARWIWEYWDTFHPQATQILDFFHVMEKIGLWATLILKEEKERKSWMKCCEELLLNNEVGEIIVQIEAVVCVGDLLKKQKELLTYLLNNQRRIQYKTYKDKGLFIGSGAIEAANKEVIQKRFKLSGQRCTKKGLQQIANLRTAQKSKKWHNVLNLIKMAA